MDEKKYHNTYVLSALLIVASGVAFLYFQSPGSGVVFGILGVVLSLIENSRRRREDVWADIGALLVMIVSFIFLIFGRGDYSLAITAGVIGITIPFLNFYTRTKRN